MFSVITTTVNSQNELLSFHGPTEGPGNSFFVIIMLMKTFKNAPVLFFEDTEGWARWLADNYQTTTGVWLKFAKKASGIKSLTYDPALDEALCYGWIDGQTKSIDAIYYMQKFTPRRARSMWSKRNVGKITELTKAGRMKPSGLAQVEAAKLDGRWDQAYDAPSTITTPADFEELLNSHPQAKAVFESLNKTNKYLLLWRIQTAKKPETRKRRMEQLLAMLLEGKQTF